MKRRIFATLIAILLVLSLVACGGGGGGADGRVASTNGNIRIAVAAPLTGARAAYGQGFVNAANLQAENWNAAGGINGRTIEIATFDDADSSDEAASIAYRLAGEDDIFGVIGSWGSAPSMTAAEIYQEHEMILISPSASHLDFPGIGDFIFRTQSLMDGAIAILVDMAEELGLTNVGIMHLETEWGVATANLAERAIEASGSLTVVAREGVVSEENPDYSSAIANFEAASSEVIFTISAYSVLAPFARQYRAVNPSIELFATGNAYDQALLNLVSDDFSVVEGLRIPVRFFADADLPIVRDFTGRYIAEFGYSPSALTAQAYDAVGILLTAIAAAAQSDEANVTDSVFEIPTTAIRTAMFATSYTGVSGLIEFADDGDVAIPEFYRVVVRSGRFTEA
ncbi:MAG: ABC transporter substrate-binding protein [Oscillospiraceae bacterium]|nr:ABC transporter substrate-binding protein [Oscillospiraceae bacterium]